MVKWRHNGKPSYILPIVLIQSVQQDYKKPMRFLMVPHQWSVILNALLSVHNNQGNRLF